MGNFPRDPSTDSNSQYQSSGGATVMSDTEDTADIIKGSSDKRFVRFQPYIGSDARKPVYGVSNEVRSKPVG